MAYDRKGKRAHQSILYRLGVHIARFGSECRWAPSNLDVRSDLDRCDHLACIQGLVQMVTSICGVSPWARTRELDTLDRSSPGSSFRAHGTSRCRSPAASLPVSARRIHPAHCSARCLSATVPRRPPLASACARRYRPIARSLTPAAQPVRSARRRLCLPARSDNAERDTDAATNRITAVIHSGHAPGLARTTSLAGASTGFQTRLRRRRRRRRCKARDSSTTAAGARRFRCHWT